MFSKIKKLFSKNKHPKNIKSEKDQFTEKGEPGVGIARMDVDPENLSDGSFDLDWNDIFVARLMKLGYKGKNDHEIVESWFSQICYNIVAETYEQEIADPDKRKIIQHKQLENGRIEHS